MSLGTVKSSLHRAVHRLRERLQALRRMSFLAHRRARAPV